MDGTEGNPNDSPRLRFHAAQRRESIPGLRKASSAYTLLVMTGVVKFYNETKGFGFIKSDEDGSDVFVHTTGLMDNVKENDRVTFEVIEGKKGLNAVNVRLVG